MNFPGERSTSRTTPIRQSNECAKAIIQCGIRTLIYGEDKYGDTAAVRASKRMLNAAGVRYYQYGKTGRELKIFV